MVFEVQSIFSLRAFALMCLAAGTIATAQARFDAEAIRINNRGVAEMGQQFTDRAAVTFADAMKKDPKLAQAAVNEGIALLTLQKLDEAKKALQTGLALDPKSPQAWYNLGLAQHAGNESEDALRSFQKAVELDPRDADSFYFLGVCYSELKQYDKAIAVFKQAIEIDPNHASSEFAMARAMQRSGDVTNAKEHFKRFQHLTNAKIGAAIGLAYGEQGHYSIVTAVAEPQAVQKAMIPVKLVAQPIALGPEVSSPTGGACLMDVAGSGHMDLVLMQNGAHAIRVLHANGDGTFADFDAEAAGLKAFGHAVACAVGDFDGDGLNDLAVALDDRVLLFRNLGNGKFQDVTAAAGLSAKNRPTGITFIDYDHDGDLDLFLTGAPLTAGGRSNVLWRNNGDKTFTEWTEPAGLGGSGKTEAAILTDFNNDHAVDIAVTGDGPSPLIYVNPREGKYPQQSAYDFFEFTGIAKDGFMRAASRDEVAVDRKAPKKPVNQQGIFPPATNGIAMLDFNKDGWMDIAVTHAGAPGLTLWRNVEGPNHIGRRFERVELPLHDALRGWGVTAIDIDNDGWIDLAAIVETKSGPQVRVLRNRGDGTFEDVSKALGLDQVKLQRPRGLIAADVDGDGAADLIVTQEDAPPVLLRNIGANKNHFVRLELTGFADNKTALGAKVEVFAGGQWQKWELAGASGYQTQAPPQILVGLGNANGIDLLRILWPTGVLQDEIDLPALKDGHGVIAMKEADRRGSSCPVLFVWDGHKYRLVTDVIGAGVVGHWFTPQRRNIPNPGEWIKVVGAAAALVDGKLSMRFMEPMEEVNYIDQLRLVAVDHPSDVTVNPDERFLDDPPFASGRVIASSATRQPAAALDGEGHDALAALSHAEHTFASGFTPTSYDGFANLHALTLDLGNVDTHAPLKLLMTGYVNYFSATSLYAAWQAGIKPISPYVEAEMPDGSWKRILDDAGFPAGLERTLVVDLSGRLPAGAHRIRLMANLEIFWDQVLIDNHPEAASRSTEVPLAFATEHFRGYPKQIEGASPGDLNYDYDRVSLTGPFQHQRGNYTRMGDVTALVKGIDDRYAIFGSGEEIALEFDAAALPTLPARWTRDYFFYANGFVKDMDWWDASPFTVAQLPFHHMSAYPYPAGEHFPDGPAAIDYQLNFNDRFDSGEPVRSYRFNYQYLPSTPAEDRAIKPGGTASNTAAPISKSPGAPSFTRSVRERWDATPQSSSSTNPPSAQAAQP
jgi:tetratricopeptide (TPR) repeat protein